MSSKRARPALWVAALILAAVASIAPAQSNLLTDENAELKKEGDTNGDGQISEAEKEAMRQPLKDRVGEKSTGAAPLLEKLKNRSGNMSLQGPSILNRGNSQGDGQNRIVARLIEMRRSADTDGDGQISETEKFAMQIKVLEEQGGKMPVSHGKPGPASGFTEGAKSLFIGHSFFVPVARSFDQLASAGGFPGHEAQVVFAPGPAGSPEKLWGNPQQREKIEAILATGEIEIFGMTTIMKNGTIDDYERWIELALKYNPETKIMIGQSWMAGGPNLEDEIFETVTETIAMKSFADVQKLRESYPNRIYYINYGFVGPEMKIQFNAGNLPDINQLVGLGDDTLFRDGKIGHAGKLMHELCALTWTAALYDADINEVNHSDFSPQAEAIAQKAIQNNSQYR